MNECIVVVFLTRCVCMVCVKFTVDCLKCVTVFCIPFEEMYMH